MLLWQTLRHHVGNWLRLPRSNSETFAVELDLGGAERSVVGLRTRAGDLSILYEVFAEKAYQVAERQLPTESVAVVVDCGAHIGLSALYFANRYRNARVFAVEPNPDNFQRLVANTAAEPRIVPIHGCVADHSGTTHISIEGPGWGHTVDPDGAAVPAYTIDDIRHRYGFSMIDLLKVDIEGAEREVFALGVGAVRVIAAELHGDYTIECFARDVAPMNVFANEGQDTVLATS